MAEEKARDPTKPEIKPVSIPLSKIHDLPGSVFAPLNFFLKRGKER